jgi:cell division protein FtsQ
MEGKFLPEYPHQLSRAKFRHPRYPHHSDSSRSRPGLRTEDLFSAPPASVLEAIEDHYAPSPSTARRRSRQPDSPSRRDFGEDFAASLPDTGSYDSALDERQRRQGVRLRVSGKILRVPKTVWGRIAGGITIVLVLCSLGAAAFAVHRFFLHDSRFVVESSSSIQTVGNTHLTRAQLLSVFGEDVDRNIFQIPLAERRAELESLPWIERATVMRLLPNHLRISVTERVPVAFVRQERQIGLVDAKGVLLDMPSNAPGDPHYSFPVITGIAASDPLSLRAARMRLYADFVGALDNSGQKISEGLSEVDLSNPEDVKALIPEGSSDILVHFGDTDFLARYQRFEQHLPEWRTLYPKLSAVDMRYERQVVLNTQTSGAALSEGSNAPLAATGVQAGSIAKTSVKPAPASLQKPAKRPSSEMLAATKPSKKPAPKPATDPNVWHMVVVKPHTKSGAAVHATAPTHAPQAIAQ